MHSSPSEFSAVLIELLEGGGPVGGHGGSLALDAGHLQGASARGLDFLGGGRWDGITERSFCGSAIPVAMFLLLIGGGSHWAIAAFHSAVWYGQRRVRCRPLRPYHWCSYDQAEFAKATSRIALPLNLISQRPPPVLVGLLTQFGSDALLGLAMACSCGALLILLWLREIPSDDRGDGRRTGSRCRGSRRSKHLEDRQRQHGLRGKKTKDDGHRQADAWSRSDARRRTRINHAGH